MMKGRFRIVPPTQQSFLAFDFGKQRTGVAAGSRIANTSSALKTIRVASNQARFAAIEALIKEWQPHALVLGIPFHPDGAAHEMTLICQRFSRQLQGRFHLPVHEVDERYSSVQAAAQGAKDLDAAAACIILEQFFSEIQT